MSGRKSRLAGIRPEVKAGTRKVAGDDAVPNRTRATQTQWGLNGEAEPGLSAASGDAALA